MSEIKKIYVTRYEQNTVKEEEDSVVEEYPFTIFLNGEELVTLLCTPTYLDYLALGFLYSEGMIKSKEEILFLRVEKNKGIVEIETKNKNSLGIKLHGKRMITSGCGKGTIFYQATDSLYSKKVESSFKIKAVELLELMTAFNRASRLFIETGGVHSAAISDGKSLILFHEDIGRHNAIDRLIGEALTKEIQLKDKVLMTSGRISSEMLMKAAKQGIPILVSRSAPTSLALELAEKLQITVVGFARGRRMNVYTEKDRII